MDEDNPFELQGTTVFGTNKFNIKSGLQSFNIPKATSTGYTQLQRIPTNSASSQGGVAQMATGLVQTVGSLFGGRKRRREQRAAAAELQQRRAAYETFEFKDPSANMTNPFEDITINQQQAQFEAQQQQQALASTLTNLSAAAGGSGVASLAQTLAQQQATNLQRSAASIGAQESRAQILAAQGAQSLQRARAQGMMAKQQFEFGRTETLLDMAAQRKLRADEARRKATENLIGGISNIGAGAASGGIEALKAVFAGG